MMRYTKFIPMLALALMLSAGAAHAQTGYTTGTGAATGTSGTVQGATTAGTPNTGAGGATPANLITLVGSAAVLAAGATYLLRTRRS